MWESSKTRESLFKKRLLNIIKLLEKLGILVLTSEVDKVSIE